MDESNMNTVPSNHRSRESDPAIRPLAEKTKEKMIANLDKLFEQYLAGAISLNTILDASTENIKYTLKDSGLPLY